MKTCFSRIVHWTLCLAAVSLSNAVIADEGAPGEQVELKYQTSDAATVDYLLYLPENYEEQAELPLVLFLHGRGESYGPLGLVAKWGPPRFAERGDDLPFILVSPQCPRDDQWASETQQKRIDELLNQIVSDYKVDRKRTYLTGLSMGGYGSWTMAARHPDRFAAVIPVCGGGDPKNAEQYIKTPIWIFHGDQDKAVPFSRSEEMVQAIEKAGGKSIRFTTLEHIGHNSWSAAYASPGLFDWMLQQKLK